MEITISLAELQKRKLFVATPMYGGQCAGMYTKSMCDLTQICQANGIEIRSYFLFNESLITRARNYCVDEFLRSDCTHLLFIDSDIGFNPQDIFAMLALQSDESPYDVLAAPYPKKCISWEKIKAAVDKGVADENPSVLENFVGDYVFNPVVGEGAPTEIPLGEPAQVLETGTGFMMIRRQALKMFDAAYPQYSYLPDHVRTEHFDGTREIMMYFQAEVDPATKRYLSEDYWFCQKLRQAGGKVWLCPWMELKHVGAYIFGGSLAAIASIGASATADSSAIKPKTKAISHREKMAQKKAARQ
jgi:hypothetical protein